MSHTSGASFLVFRHGYLVFSDFLPAVSTGGGHFASVIGYIMTGTMVITFARRSNTTDDLLFAAFIFKSLRFIPTGHGIPLLSQKPTSSPYKIFFNLYKPSTPFRKSAPPPPDFSVVVVKSVIAEPSLHLFDMTDSLCTVRARRLCPLYLN